MLNLLKLDDAGNNQVKSLAGSDSMPAQMAVVKTRPRSFDSTFFMPLS